jgi:hypothetical protein
MKNKRLVTFACVGALLIIAAAFYLHFWQSRPIGTGPAGPHVPSAFFSRPWSEKQFLLVGLGDSVTAGFGARRGYLVNIMCRHIELSPKRKLDYRRSECRRRASIRQSVKPVSASSPYFVMG